MKIQSDYPIGARVELSNIGKKSFSVIAGTETGRGFIVGHCRDPRCIRIKRDGYPNPDEWQAIHWRVVSEAGA